MVGVLCLSAYWYPERWVWHGLVQDLYANLATSILSIAGTVLLIDRLYERRDVNQLKKRLIWEMGSSDRAAASRAVKELRDSGWLSGGDLRGVDLTKADLSQTDLSGGVFAEVNFSFATLVSADFSRADATGARFEECEARRVILKGAVLTNASLKNAKLGGAILDDVESAGGTDLLGASLLKASLRGARLPGVKLDGCDLLQCDMSNADLSGADLRGAVISEANLESANLERANLGDLVGWERIRSIEGARLTGIRNPPPGFIAWAMQEGADFGNAKGRPSASSAKDGSSASPAPSLASVDKPSPGDEHWSFAGYDGSVQAKKAHFRMGGAEAEREPVREHFIIESDENGDKWDVELPIDVYIDSILKKISEHPQLPFLGRTGACRLTWRERDLVLPMRSTLRSIGVAPGATLVVSQNSEPT
ncbi:pentapeptide repeat-containing protein [Micromonospora wenchangensis]|uniref:pentapeptide repeat-containing protein n=1 Tax=Micromonospora wenchangensis TaxID=1185415 RepID=UPI00343EA6B1